MSSFSLSKPKRLDRPSPSLAVKEQACDLGSAKPIFLCRILNLKEAIQRNRDNVHITYGDDESNN